MKIVKQWAEEKNITKPIEIQYTPLATLFGRTTRLKDRYIITINENLKPNSITARPVLWHEFAHVWDDWETHSFGHEEKWIRKWFSKPWYVALQVLVFAVAIYRFLK